MNDPNQFDWLPGGGEMGAGIRGFDWSGSPIGTPGRWSDALRTTVRIILASRFPHILWWGPDYVQFYNDPYIPIPGCKHPQALGQPGSACWAEIWNVIGPLIDTPYNGGAATWDDDIALEMNRHGFVEETHFTIAYSPVPDDSAPNGIGGVLATVHEITDKVLGERRTVILREIATHSSESRTVEKACESAARILDAHPLDVPFAMIYLLDKDGRAARLAAASGIQSHEPIALPPIDLDQSGGWPFREVKESRGPALIEVTDHLFRDIPDGPWTDPPSQAAVLPIAGQGSAEVAGFLIGGISARLRFDDAYRGFYELLTSQIGTAIAGARSHEEERRRAEALAELDRAKIAFFNNVSHEFRTPLTLMLAPLEELLSRSHTDLSPSTKNQLEMVNRNGFRLLRLVNTLLDFSRVEAGRVEAAFEPTDLAAFTTDLAAVFRAAIERAGLRLEVDCPALPEPVFVDREMWERIVLNLLTNAFKFTFEGEIEVRLRADAGFAELQVRDTGVGVPAAEIGKLFERFHRIENSRSRTHEGTGIGLALVQELARLHGGSARVESIQGSGTTFFVSIPLGSAHLDPARVGTKRLHPSTATGAAPYVDEALRWLPRDETTSVEEADGDLPSLAAVFPAGAETDDRPHVLVADDNADMRQYLARLLAERYEVTVVAEGIAALAVVRERRPDLILTDVMMPGLDGIGLLRQVRGDDAACATPVIVLSARAGEESRLGGLAAGADDYLVKPFSARELLARVESHLSLARMRQDSERRVGEILGSITDGFHVIDSLGRFTYFNEAARRMFGANGLDTESLVGRDLFNDVFADAPENDGMRSIHRALTERIPTETENFWPPWKRWFAIRNFPTSDGGVSTFFQDITERKTRKEALNAKDSELEQITNSTTVMLARCSRDFRYQFVNRACAEFLRTPREKIIGTPIADIMGEAAFAAIKPYVERALLGETVEYEIEVPYAAAGLRYMHVTYSPERNPDGEVTGWVASILDVTDRKRTEQALQAHTAEIDALNARLRQAMRETHHRVKNNLQVVSALVDLQTMSDESTVPVAELQRIGRHIRSLAAIHDLLTGSPRTNGDSEQVLASDIMSKLEPLMRSIVNQRTLRFLVDDFALTVRQSTSFAVLVNQLVSNAVKHGKGEIEVCLAIERDHARLTVTDSGPGFAEGFDPRESANTGLDLIENLSRHDLQGVTTYRNVPDGGGQVTVDFPWRQVRTVDH
jgi:PAS domain S-box-containing protein